MEENGKEEVMNIYTSNYNTIYNRNNNISMGGRISKKKCQQMHFMNSCLNRVGEMVDRKEVIKMIQEHKLEFLKKQSNVITKYKIRINEKDYMVVYHKKNKEVVSILPYTEGIENAEENKDNLYWWLTPQGIKSTQNSGNI